MDMSDANIAAIQRLQEAMRQENQVPATGSADSIGAYGAVASDFAMLDASGKRTNSIINSPNPLMIRTNLLQSLQQLSSSANAQMQQQQKQQQDSDSGLSDVTQGFKMYKDIKNLSATSSAQPNITTQNEFGMPDILDKDTLLKQPDFNAPTDISANSEIKNAATTMRAPALKPDYADDPTSQSPSSTLGNDPLTSIAKSADKDAFDLGDETLFSPSKSGGIPGTPPPDVGKPESPAQTGSEQSTMGQNSAAVNGGAAAVGAAADAIYGSSAAATGTGTVVELGSAGAASEVGGLAASEIGGAAASEAGASAVGEAAASAGTEAGASEAFEAIGSYLCALFCL